MAKKSANETQNRINQAFDAILRGAIDELKELLDKGISPDAKDDKGTPLVVKAADTRKTEIVELLLDRGADIKAADDEGNTGLHIATNNEDFPMAQVFKSLGADENIRNKDGSTPLQTALDYDLHAFSALFAAHSGTLTVLSDSDNSGHSVHGEPTAGTPDKPYNAEQNVSEDEPDIDLESIEVRGFDSDGEAGEQEVIPITTVVTATAAAQTLGETPSLLDSLEDTVGELAQFSPDFFKKPQGTEQRKMSLDEMGKLVEDTEHESEDKQKYTSKVIAIQFVLQPGLANEMKERKNFRHAGTIRRLKLGGDADLKLGKRGMDTAPFGASQLQELAKCPTDQIMIDCAREAIAKKLSVRDIRKLVTPFVKKAKMEASGALTDMSPQCVRIIEGLEQPDKLMEQQPTMLLLQDADRLRAEFTFPELSRIHEKARAAETKVKKQKMALEEKSAGYEPVINFLRLIRNAISAVFEGNKG